MRRSMLRQAATRIAIMVAAAACRADRVTVSLPILELAAADGEVPVGNEPHVLTLPDERVVITAMGTHAVIIYDFERTKADTVGRDGGGPGEFALPSTLGSWSDGRFTVLDEMLRRVTVIGSDLHIDTVFAFPNTEFVVHVSWFSGNVTRLLWHFRRRLPVVRFPRGLAGVVPGAGPSLLRAVDRVRPRSRFRGPPACRPA